MEAVDRLVQQDKNVLPLVWVHDYHLTLAAALIRKVKQLITLSHSRKVKR